MEIRSYTAADGAPGVVVGITPQVGRELCTGQRVLQVPLSPVGLGPWAITIVDQDWIDAHPGTGFVGMGPVIELRAADFDALDVAEPVRREIEAHDPLWPAFEVKLWKVSNLDDLSAVA
ncbi:hypothetical protein ABZ896_12485 [Streptomyces sp. NPDC047072]|uniref:hypothetical protein n=1 Tax=Streptomyces sp. NPDC047072 TaxID=3154809 RepID=UPI00340F40BD